MVFILIMTGCESNNGNRSKKYDGVKVIDIEAAVGPGQVMDNTQVKVFYSNGKYLSTVNRQGRGPEEYPYILHVSVYPENGNIVVFTSAGIINEYDVYGNFISQVKVPELDGHYLVTYFKLNKNTYVASIHQHVFNKRSCSAVLFDSLSNIKLTIPTPKKYSESRVARIPMLVQFGEKIRIIHGDVDMDTVYSVTPNLTIEEPYIFNYGKYKMPYNKQHYSEVLASKIHNNITLTGNMIESNEYLLLKFDFRGIKTEAYERRWNIVCGLFNKKNGELSLLREPYNGILGFRNDLDEGPVFWPSAQSFDNSLITFYSADKFIEFANSGLASDKVKDIAAGLRESDNPVVAIVKLKNTSN